MHLNCRNILAKNCSSTYIIIYMVRTLNRWFPISNCNNTSIRLPKVSKLFTNASLVTTSDKPVSIPSLCRPSLQASCPWGRRLPRAGWRAVRSPRATTPHSLPCYLQGCCTCCPDVLSACTGGALCPCRCHPSGSWNDFTACLNFTL